MSIISKTICATKLLFSKKVISTKFCLTYPKFFQIAFMVTIIIPFNPALLFLQIKRPNLEIMIDHRIDLGKVQNSKRTKTFSRKSSMYTD